jgi:hypothetical protein
VVITVSDWRQVAVKQNLDEALPMSIACEGCKKVVKIRGYRNHILQSRDPRCAAQDDSILGNDTEGDFEEQQSHLSPQRQPSPPSPSQDLPWPDSPLLAPCLPLLDNQEGPTQAGLALFDPTADLFGQHGIILDAVFAKSDAGDAGNDDGVDDETGPCHDDQDDLDEEADQGNSMDLSIPEEEGGLEPVRPIMDTPEVAPSAMDEDETPHSTLRLRGGAEEGLKMKPVVVRYRRQASSKEVNDGEPGYQFHQNQDSNRDNDNPYAPFGSKMEWEIAKWAKLRGPSSTAFTELMAIDGVSNLEGIG